MAELITTLGNYRAEQLNMILPHEHIFVDLGPIEEENWRNATADPVINMMGPELEAIRAQGFDALVECTPVGVGRRVDIVKAVSAAMNFPVVVATGIYREPWIPAWAQAASEDELTRWMLDELTDGIRYDDEKTGVRAAWIKLSAGDDGITECEAKLLRAAACAGAETGAIIGSHTIRGRVALEQIEIIEKAGYSAGRFIWIHTQNEPDVSLHLEAARRGAWIEYDAIGSPHISDEQFIAHIQRTLDAGYGDQLLLSHDRGWFDPSKRGGGTPQPFTYLVDEFLPKLRQAGVGDETIRKLMHENPFRAYAR